jgi:predicted nucleic acid-binding protein
MIIVCDSSPIIALALCKQLELLDKLFNDVLIPLEVYNESTKEGKEPTPVIKKWAVGKVVEVIDRQKVNHFNQTLDKGESEAIALALEKMADYLLIDEKKGRKTASENGIQVIGSLGVLIMGKRKGLLQSIKPSLDILRSSSTRISDFLYEQALKIAGETPQ